MTSLPSLGLQRGYLHRDLKPENILVDSTGEAVLSDFETSKQVDFAPMNGTSTPGSPRGGSSQQLGASASATGTVTHAVFVSQGYTAPELLREGNAAYSPASDMYAFGVVACMVLLGLQQPPKKPADCVRKSEAMRAAPNNLTSTLLRLLSDKPRDRPSADKLLMMPLFRLVTS
jgi:serine/threonine protein kinase